MIYSSWILSLSVVIKKIENIYALESGSPFFTYKILARRAQRDDPMYMYMYIQRTDGSYYSTFFALNFPTVDQLLQGLVLQILNIEAELHQNSKRYFPYTNNSQCSSVFVKGDEVSLQRVLNMVHRNTHDYVAILFYASWCPFSAIFRPSFSILPSLYPSIPHFAIEESVIRPRQVKPILFIELCVSCRCYMQTLENNSLI